MKNWWKLNVEEKFSSIYCYDALIHAEWTPASPYERFYSSRWLMVVMTMLEDVNIFHRTCFDGVSTFAFYALVWQQHEVKLINNKQGINKTLKMDPVDYELSENPDEEMSPPSLSPLRKKCKQ